MRPSIKQYDRLVTGAPLPTDELIVAGAGEFWGINVGSVTGSALSAFIKDDTGRTFLRIRAPDSSMNTPIHLFSPIHFGNGIYLTVDEGSIATIHVFYN